MAPPDEAEKRYRRLWRCFYDTIAIRERENPEAPHVAHAEALLAAADGASVRSGRYPPSPSPCAAFCSARRSSRDTCTCDTPSTRAVCSLRQRLEKAQQDRHALLPGSRSIAARRESCSIRLSSGLSVPRSVSASVRRPSPAERTPAQRQVGIRDLLDAQPVSSASSERDRFAPELHPQLLPRTIDALRPLAQSPTHLYRAVVTEKSPYFTPRSSVRRRWKTAFHM